MKKSNDQPTDSQRLAELLPVLVDDALSPAQNEELVQILMRSEDAREHYLTYLQVHSEIGSLWGNASPVDLPLAGDLANAQNLAKPVPMAGLKSGWFSGVSNHSVALVACLVGIICALSVSLLLLLNGKIGGNHDASTLLAERQVIISPDAAVVVRMDGTPAWGLSVGHRLKPGRIELDHGSVQLEFMSGAVVAFAGPGELDIHSKDAATLVSGSVSAFVPERARGFVLNAPDAAIFDLGTEFNVNVDPSGVSEIEVTSGEVELSLLGSDGNTLTSKRVHESTRMRVDAEGRSFVKLEPGGERLSEIFAFDDSGLPVTSEYVDEVVRGAPFFYCRFEDSAGDSIPNHMSDQLALRADPPESLSKSIRLSNGHVKFSRSQAPRRLIMDDVVEGLNEGPYTIEFWMKPDDLQHSTCVAVFPDSRTDNGSFINVVEVVTDTFMVHEPGALRFLHRSPPGHDFEQGTNAFTPGVCVPGQWHHVVAVKTDDTMELYVNGQLMRQVELKEDQRHGPGTFHFVLGQLRDDWSFRHFAGGMDELAIYKRALTPAEVENHFDMIDRELRATNTID